MAEIFILDEDQGIYYDKNRPKGLFRYFITFTRNQHYLDCIRRYFLFLEWFVLI